MKKARFIFLIGLPRSGTKLLRDILNNHNDIYIDPLETQFIPFVYEKFKNKNLKEKIVFYELFSYVNNSVYAINIKKSSRKSVSFEEWYGYCSDYSISEVLNVFYFLNSKIEKKEVKVIGDKTPRYTGHLNLLKELFPEARFIHIIRDPRDRALSESNVWTKSQLKSVDDWRRVIEKVQEFKVKNPKCIVEVKYEDLIFNYINNIKRILEFLELPYQSDLNKFKKTTEKYGDAKGALDLIAKNSFKYKEEITRRKIKRLEELSFDLLLKYQYEVNYAKKHKEMSILQRKILGLSDLILLCRFHIKDKGLKDGVKYFNKMRGK